MLPRTGLMVLVTVVLAWLSPAWAAGTGEVIVDAGARVTKVDAGKKPRITIDRGKKAGLKVGDTGSLYPMRIEEQDPSPKKLPVVDWDVRIAQGKVVEVKDHTAVVALDSVVDTVEVGAYFAHRIAVPRVLGESPLFRVVAMNIGLGLQYEDTLHITVEQMLADPSEALRNKTLDSMIAEIKGMRSVVVDTLKERIEGGAFHGKTAGDVVDALDRQQMLDFLGFVEAFPGKYFGHRWRVPEVYFTWVINGTPSGERHRKLRQADSTIMAAYEAVEAGKLDQARALWKDVLKLVPDHKTAAQKVAAIDKILLLTRTVAADPDDTATSYTLADELFNLGAYTMAMKATEPVRKRGYEPFKTERLRAYLFVRLKNYKEAEAIFKRLIKDRPDDPNLVEWLAYTRANAKVAKNPKDPTGYLELAAVNIKAKNWTNALANYRKVLDNPKATAAQKDIAKAAQERISIQRDLDQRYEWAKDAITSHNVKSARERIKQVLALTTKLKDDAQAGKLVEELAQLARSSSEEELALELLNERVKQVPTSMAAHAALAYALVNFDRIAEAEAAAKKSLEQKGDPAYSYLILSYVARAREDFAEMEKLAKKATANSPRYAWPLLVLARSAAIRGDWEEALVHAKKALDLEPDEYDMRSTHIAVHRGLAAAEALQSNPNNARERLRLVRAYAGLGIKKRVAEEIAKLPADGSWRSDGWLALMDSPDSRVSLKDRLEAGRASKTTWESRKRNLAIYELRTALRANPTDDAKRIELARLYLKSEDFDMQLATLGPLMHKTPLDARVGDLVHDARQAMQALEQIRLAREATKRNDYTGAVALANQAIKVFDRIKSSYGPIGAREALSDAYAGLGRYPEAIAVAETIVKLAAAEGDPVSLSIVAQRVGSLKANVGTTEAQRKALEDGQKVCEERDDELTLFYAALQLAQLEKDEGRMAVSLDHARRAWTLADKLGRADLARTARWELADANIGASRYTDAEGIVTKLLADSRKANDVHNEQASLIILGFVAMMRGEGAKARGYYQEVYNLGTRIGDTAWRAHARRLEGTSWLQADHDPAKAAVALEQAATLYTSLGDGWATQSLGGVLRSLADAHLMSNKLGPARKAAQEALALAQRFQRPPALGAAHWMLSLISIKENKADDALRHAQTALGLAQKGQDDAMLWNAWHAVAKANELKKLDQAALDAYEKALEFLGKALQATGGETEKKGYMNTGRVRELYSDAIQRLLQSGKTQRAMEILELSRDAMLKQQFDPTKVQTKDAKARANLAKIQEHREQVKSLQKRLDAAMEKPTAQRSESQVRALSQQIAKTKQEMNQVVLDLKVSHRQLFQALAMDPQNLVGRKDSLPPGSVLVSYFLAEDALYAFVIARNLSQPAVVRVKVTASELEGIIADWREAIIAENAKVKQRDRVEELGRKLDDLLLEPLRPHLTNASALILLPFGPLYYVPFDALVVSEPGQPVRYAIEDFRISIQTATTLEHLLKPHRAKGSGTMLAISNPDGSLPGAQVEVSRIVKNALPDAHVLGRGKATVKKFVDMAGGFRYLHIATHGILDADPRKSYMKFSDGPLTVETISQLQGLDTANELVVLSACDTAVEKGKSNGDELVSVAVAFSMAGSPALVASLWEVSDDSTAELMATFYKALEQSKGDRLDALREAKLALLRMKKANGAKPFAEPWHWSSFQMYGDYRTPGSPN